MTPLDLVVVGGGITGLGVARLAARNGFTVAVLERADLASGASSGTSHMLHGGLRYLEHGHLSLVREALRERAALTKMAPHLARPTRFVLPFYRGDRRPRWLVRLGLWAYDAFAGPAGLSSHAMARRRETLRLEPGLASRGLVGAALYSDAVMDDAGLAVAVARDAAAHGATVLPYTEVVGARPADHPGGAVEVLARDRLAGNEIRLAARAVVNATGAWADRTRTLLLRSLHPGAPDPEPVMRPTRGIHLVFPPITRGHGVLLFARSDGRVFFLVPFAGHTLVGTTEVEVPSTGWDEPSPPSVEEIRYLRAELGRAFPGTADAPALAVTVGLRPLLAGPDAVTAAPREHRVIEDGPLLTLVGGKYTTFRVMARDLVRRLARRFQHGAPIRDPIEPLPRLPGGAGIEALAEAAVAEGFARRLEDVIRRRSALWLTPDRGRVAAPAVVAVLSRRLGWSAARGEEELRAFHAALDREERLLEAARTAA